MAMPNPNPDHLAKINEGVAAWNDWRKANPDVGPELDEMVMVFGRRDFMTAADLRGAKLCVANLTHANLDGADLRRADLRRANLSRAQLGGADLWEANLRVANLDHAVLAKASLRKANFVKATLIKAILVSANLGGAQLSGADLSGAIVGETVLGDLDLSAAKGLESVGHKGPSTIGIDTLFRSGGKIPEAFLRGAGVPDKLIAYARSLVGEAIEFYSCFINFSSQDQPIAERLNADLRAKNLRCWFAPEDMRIGDRFQERIEDSIRLYDKVMIVLSENSVASPWVESEVEAARERERHEKRTVLFPIRIDEAVMEAQQPWAADIRRQRHIGDFTKWKDHDAYEQAFARLLRDLKQKAT